MSRFETLDFCCDLTAQLEEKQIKHFAIFMQITPRFNKIHVSHKYFTKEDAENHIPKIVEFAINKLRPSEFVVSRFDFINKTTNIIKQQGIDYIICLLIDDELELIFGLHNPEAMMLGCFILGNMPNVLYKFFDLEDTTGENDD